MSPFEAHPITLRHVVYDNAWLRTLLEAIAEHLPPRIVTIGYSYGTGPWNRFLGVDERQSYFFLDSDGRREQELLGRLTDADPWKAKLAVNVGRLLRILFDISSWNTQPDHCALLVRPDSLIIMGGQRHALPSGNLYIPSPIATGHARLEAPERLERDFPGMFRFPEGTKDGRAA